jgi:acetyl-CoA/propionyl-CoA carboxylase biotin carboxyl carrier protein
LDQAALISPMHGTVAAIRKQEGETIEAGEPIFIVEAMKMENEIRAHRGGHLSKICVGLGDTVETGQPLAEIT